jgi:hypothetical protein
MSKPRNAGASRLKKEAILFGLLLAFGLLLLPVAIYLVGNSVFGDYGDGGIADFFAAVFTRLLSADLATLFLVLSPYLIWQTLRLSIVALRWRVPTG